MTSYLQELRLSEFKHYSRNDDRPLASVPQWLGLLNKKTPLVIINISFCSFPFTLCHYKLYRSHLQLGEVVTSLLAKMGNMYLLICFFFFFSSREIVAPFFPLIFDNKFNLSPFWPSFLVGGRLNEKFLCRSFHQLVLTGFSGVTSFSDKWAHCFSRTGSRL